MLDEILSLVVTFHMKTSAMKMDKYAKEHNISGKLTAISDELTAGSSFAWISDISDKENIK